MIVKNEFKTEQDYVDDWKKLEHLEGSIHTWENNNLIQNPRGIRIVLRKETALHIDFCNYLWRKVRNKIKAKMMNDLGYYLNQICAIDPCFYDSREDYKKWWKNIKIDCSLTTKEAKQNLVFMFAILLEKRRNK